ncbi:MAG: AAA family ATPase, partial [Enterococcus faecium]
NDAFDTAGESKSYQTIADLDAGNFKKTTLFIMAESGAGKTVLSKKIISILQSVALKKMEQRWDYCLTASNNAFDEYNGQDIIFLDDIRGDSLSVSDWLKLLDPYTISPISARYHNKMGSAKAIIITSTKTPSEFFSIAKGNFHEDLGQFFRRIDLLINIEDDKFHLSKSEKAPPASTQFPYVIKPPSHYFHFDGTYHKNKALDMVTKTVIRNMQLNKKKPVTQPAKANVTDHLKK